MKLPKGYDTEVGELETPYPVRKQRIGIARAFLPDQSSDSDG